VHDKETWDTSKETWVAGGGLNQSDLTGGYVKRDLPHIKRDLSHIKRDLSHIKRDLTCVNRLVLFFKRGFFSKETYYTPKETCVARGGRNKEI